MVVSYQMMSFFGISLIVFIITLLIHMPVLVNCFNFNAQTKTKNYLVLKIINKSNRNLTAEDGELFCEEDPFCGYFLFHIQKKEIRLCYDKGSILKNAKYDELWITGVKEMVFENFAPSLVNVQGLCTHKVDKFFFNTLNDAIEKKKELKANFMILNFQSKENQERKIEGYFCEALDDLVDRDGYVVFDFTKLDKPHQSCLRVRKCGLRGSIQSDDSKLEEGIYPGDVVEPTNV